MAFEGSSIKKIKDIYYFIYSSQKNHDCATPQVNIPTEISLAAEQLFQTVMWGSRAEKEKKA